MSKITSKMTCLNPDTPFTNDIERAQTLYFNWLCTIVHIDNYLNMSWYILAKLLHNIEYYWVVSNDDNRATDGVKLRQKWLNLIKDEADNLGVEGPTFPLDSLCGPCTLLEMLVGLSIRIESDIMQNESFGDRTAIWFWKMIHNILCYDNSKKTLIMFSDNEISTKEGDEIKEKFTKMMDRDYLYNGSGGLFPLNNNLNQDQKTVEVWYQAQEWLKENYFNEFY